MFLLFRLISSPQFPDPFMLFLFDSEPSNRFTLCILFSCALGEFTTIVFLTCVRWFLVGVPVCFAPTNVFDGAFTYSVPTPLAHILHQLPSYTFRGPATDAPDLLSECFQMQPKERIQRKLNCDFWHDFYSYFVLLASTHPCSFISDFFR